MQESTMSDQLVQDLISLWERDDDKKSTKRLRRNVIKALLSLSFPDVTNDFMAAYQTAPNVVATESDPMLFLRCQASPDDFRGAAMQLCKYWTSRRRLFEERAFWPMNTDILVEEEQEVIQKGTSVFLPPDDLGRCILFMDPTRYETSNTEKKSIRRARVVFFMLNLAALMPNRERIVCFRYNGKQHAHIQPSIRDAGLEHVPIMIDALVCLYVVPRGARRTLRQQLVPRLPEIYGPVLGSLVTVHMESSAEELLEHFLVNRGMSHSAVPPCAGGSWKHENWARWFQTLRSTKQAPPIEILSNDYEVNIVSDGHEEDESSKAGVAI